MRSYRISNNVNPPWPILLFDWLCNWCFLNNFQAIGRRTQPLWEWHFNCTAHEHLALILSFHKKETGCLHYIDSAKGMCTRRAGYGCWWFGRWSSAMIPTHFGVPDSEIGLFSLVLYHTISISMTSCSYGFKLHVNIAKIPMSSCLQAARLVAMLQFHVFGQNEVARKSQEIQNLLGTLRECCQIMRSYPIHGSHPLHNSPDIASETKMNRYEGFWKGCLQ